MGALLASGCASYREDYTRGKQNTCEIHHIKMDKTVVPVHYGLTTVDARGAAMENVSGTAFPHAEDSLNPGCPVQRTREAVIYTCSECMRARRAWETDYEAKH